MSRDLPTGLASTLNAVSIPVAFLVELDWPDGSVYLWNGYHDLSWNGHTWSGVGYLGQISEVQESSDGTANGMVISLSGIPSAYITEILRNDTQGRRAIVYFGALNVDGFAIDPVSIFDGFIDVPTLTSDGKTATISLNLEKELVDNRSAASRYTPEDQKRKYSTDLGLDFVPGIANQTFSWGKVVSTPISAGAGSGTGDGSNQIYQPT